MVCRAGAQGKPPGGNVRKTATAARLRPVYFGGVHGAPPGIGVNVWVRTSFSPLNQ